jgi:nucleotide-binding universal stress UspA family protein
MVDVKACAPRHALNVLAVLADAVSARTCLESAAAACSVDSEARLVALHVRVDPPLLVDAPELVAIQYLRERREGSARARSEDIRRVFDEWTHSGGQVAEHAEWRERIGNVAPFLLAESGEADLIVLTKPRNLDGWEALHCALYSSKRLVLYIPSSVHSADFFKYHHATIAWAPRDQARKAVARALPWLSVAGRVTVISVDQERTPQSHEIASMLASAGVRAEFKSVSADGETVGARILRELHADEAQYLVMGAYGHGPLIEWLFGQVTKEMMTRASLPIFLMH